MIRFTPLRNTKTFCITEKVGTKNEKGRVTYSHEPTDRFFRGTIASANGRQKDEFRQLGLDVTHVIVSRGRVDLKSNDVLTFDNRVLHVQVVKNSAEANIFTVVYCKEEC